jgi:hypothetical protein
MKRLLILLIVLLTVLFSNTVVAQITIHVPAQYLTIQEGINAASNGDIVLVADGLYYENINFLGKAITVASHYLLDGDTIHIESTIINGSQPNNPDSGSVVYFISGEDSSAVLCGFTITGGTGTYTPASIPPYFPFKIGGGIFCNSSGPLIKNNIIKNNNCILNEDDGATLGGGIQAGPPQANVFIIIESNKIMNNLCWFQGVSSALDKGISMGGGIGLVIDGRIQNNEIVFNESKSTYGSSVGGGIRVFQGATVSILGNIINNNSSISVVRYGFAGGISNSGGNTLIKSNRICYNSIAGGSNCYGAAIYFDLDNDLNWAIVENNFIADNYSTNGNCYGGAIGMWGSSPPINNNTIIRNSAHYGGALHTFNGSKPQIINNTIVDNNASYGGAIYSEDANTHPKIINTIMWNNGMGNEIDLYNRGNITVRYSDIEGGYTGTGNIDMDPLFRDVANDDFHLQSTNCGNNFNSLCIDMGDPAYEDWLLNCDWGLGEDRSDMGAFGGAVLVNDVPEENGILLIKYSLSQNYPNPFNPSTIISWQSPIGSWQTLKVYDILGNEVATLVDEYKPAGKYEVEFFVGQDSSPDIASGIYFYQLKAGGPETSSGQAFIETRKMILLK